MATPGPRKAQVDSSGQDTSLNSRVSEIAIQANREDESDGEEKAEHEELNFNQPFLFSDAALIVNGRKLHCHRAILSLYSPVFKAMFANRCLENQTNEVYITGDTYENVREMLVHMYTPGGVEMSHESAQNLLPILHRYQIDSMVSMAERTMAFRLNDSSAPNCLQVADLYGLTRLRRAALESCARLDAARLAQVFDEMSLSMELRQEILTKRVELLEQCLTDIQKSFSHSCTRVESRMERVPANHCPEHSRPMAEITLNSPLPSAAQGGQTHDGTSQNLVEPRLDAAASIRPAAAALSNFDMRPLDDQARTGLAGANAQTTTPVTEQTAVCEKCAEQLKLHIIELCKRGLHKIPILMCKNN